MVGICSDVCVCVCVLMVICWFTLFSCNKQPHTQSQDEAGLDDPLCVCVCVQLLVGSMFFSGIRDYVITRIMVSPLSEHTHTHSGPV